MQPGYRHHTVHPRQALYHINIFRGKDQTLWETTSDALETEVAIRILIWGEMRDYDSKAQERK